MKKKDGKAVQSQDCDVKLKKPFTASRATELLGLIKYGSFQVVKRDDVKRGPRMFGSCFIHTITDTNESNSQYRSRLVAKNYEDNDSAVIATKAQKVQ